MASGVLNIDERINVFGNVNLVICDGANVPFEDGIHVPPGSTLNIYGQKNGTGVLNANADTNEVAAIGGNDNENGGTVNIYGANVTATSYPDGLYAAGIGGDGGNGGNITINGGTVDATGGTCAAGIGGGFAGSEDIDLGGGGGNITINNCKRIEATGGIYASGIDGGNGGHMLYGYLTTKPQTIKNSDKGYTGHKIKALADMRSIIPASAFSL